MLVHKLSFFGRNSRVDGSEHGVYEITCSQQSLFEFNVDKRHIGSCFSKAWNLNMVNDKLIKFYH